jgi:hypothetical protein
MAKERLRLRVVTLGLTVTVGLMLTCLLLVGMALTGELAHASTQPQEGMDEGLPVAPPGDSGGGGVGPMFAQGVVTGRVTANSPTGLPLANVHVEFYDATALSLMSTTTNVNGFYSATVAADGDAVFVRFAITGFTQIYYDGRGSWGNADPVTLTHSGMVTDINAALTQNLLGSITGLVTDATTTNPLSSVTVSIYDASSHAFMASTLTGASGTYTVSNLGADTYKAGFRRMGYGSQYYAYVTTITGATVLTLDVASTISNVNAALGPGTGCLTGTVVAASNEVPLPAVTVTVYTPKSDLVPVTMTTPVTVTGASGSYRVCGLDGFYLIGFDKWLYVPQWYDDKPALSTADTVTVTNEQTTTNVNAVLVLGGCVSGRVVDSAGITVPTAVVTVYNSSGQIVGVPIPPPPLSDETYRACGLASGRYNVHCFDGTLDGQVTAVVTAAENTLDVICTVAQLRYTYMPIIWRNSQ